MCHLQECAALQGPEALSDLRNRCCHFARGDQHGQRPVTSEQHGPPGQSSRSYGDAAAMLHQMQAPSGEVHCWHSVMCRTAPGGVLLCWCYSVSICAAPQASTLR